MKKTFKGYTVGSLENVGWRVPRYIMYHGFKREYFLTLPILFRYKKGLKNPKKITITVEYD